MKILSTRFVPVAIDQHVHRQRKDQEGEVFAKVLKQAGRGLDGYSQGVYLFTADFRLLAFANTADAVGVRRLTEIALKKFDPKAPPVKLEETSVAPILPPPPEGGLVVNVTTKVLGGYDEKDPKSKRFRESLGRDHLWVRKDESQTLAKGTLPDSLVRRLVRYHLVDNTRGEPPMWRDDEVKTMNVVLRDGRLSGQVHLETRSKDRGFRAEVLGVVETKDGRVSRLDVVVKGKYWGEGPYVRGAPAGEYPLAVAIRLVEGERPADRVPPQGARGNLKGYLR